MSKRKKHSLDPLEEWLAFRFLGDYSKILTTQEIKRELKKSLRNEINDLLEQSNQNTTEVDLQSLYPHRKILDVFEAHLDKHMRACLSPVDGGFIIKIKKGLDSVNRRVTIAHEIGHTFLYDIDTKIPSVPYPITKRNYWIREGYTYEIARVLLVPEKSIVAVFRKGQGSPSTKTLDELSKTYQVPHNLLRMRLVWDLQLWDCIIFSAKLNSDSSITVNRSYTSKGRSYERVSIPEIIRYNSSDNRYNELYTFLLYGFNYGYNKGRINLDNREFYVESKVKSYKTGDYVLSILTHSE